jgi:hypothetical protein
LKDLESKLAQYSSTLVDHISPNGTAFKTSSLLEMLQEIGYNIRYVDVSHLNGRGEGDPMERNKESISQVVNEIYEEYSSLYGPLPWLSLVEERPVSAHEESSNELKLVDNELLRSDSPDPEEKILKPMTSICELDNLNDQLKHRAIENANNVSDISFLALILAPVTKLPGGECFATCGGSSRDYFSGEGRGSCSLLGQFPLPTRSGCPRTRDDCCLRKVSLCRPTSRGNGRRSSSPTLSSLPTKM